MNEVLIWKEQLSEFQGTEGCEHYQLLKDEFTQKIKALENINTCGNKHIRQEIIESIKTVNGFISTLESKVLNESNESKTISSDMINLEVNESLEASNTSPFLPFKFKNKEGELCSAKRTYKRLP